ncbi:MAG: hypothetical protein HYU30_04470 [Chloroflexi bacterium]|nr:hypothetical protein [Chloroflexota bacterium]
MRIRELYPNHRGNLDETEAVYENLYTSLTGKQSDARQERAKKAINGKLREYFVAPHQRILKSEFADFCSIMSNAKNEEQVFQFIVQKPYFLTRMLYPGNHGTIFIPKPKLGSELIPDFLTASFDSSGLWWYGVELESPTERMFNRDADQSATLTHALRQVQDWRRWLTNNISYARNELGFADIVGDLPCIVLIGTRENERVPQPRLRGRTRGVITNDKHGLILHHYDWLLE